MNFKVLIIVMLVLVSGVFYYGLTGKVTSSTSVHKVVRVVDGDTVELDIGQKVRLKGINTPEKSMPYADSATEFLEEMVLNKSVKVEAYGSDKYGRILGYIFLKDVNINEKILGEGLGTLYYYETDEHYEKMKNAEEFARVNDKRIWKKSGNFGCLDLVSLKYEEDGKRCTNKEVLEIANNCEKNLQVLIKDDATHIYKETIFADSVFLKNYSCIWNDEGDSVYVFDSEGLLMFYRY